MNYNNWKNRWEKTLIAIERLGGESRGLIISKPASEEEIAAVEKTLGYELPKTFREIILRFASSVEFGWELNDCIELPQEFDGIFAGECIWSLKNLLEIESERKEWVDECFSNPEDKYDRVWHNKLAFMTVGNGDKIAFDLEKYPEYTPIVYLSHDDGEGHGCILGKDFIDFIDRWTLIGCPGTEDWQIIPFAEDNINGINPNCDNALKWKKLIGLDF